MGNQEELKKKNELEEYLKMIEVDARRLRSLCLVI